MNHASEAPDERAALLASQVAGLALARYVLRLEPLASASRMLSSCLG